MKPFAPPSVVTLALFLSAAFLAGSAEAIRYGPTRLTGNLETQNIFRAADAAEWQFIQQRNTFRLELDQQLARSGDIAGDLGRLPFIRKADLFLYYRLVYDSVYDIAPGPFQEATDGSRGPSLANIAGRFRDDVAWENNIREFYLDLELEGLPLSFRIGKQQIVWGNAALNQRALDSVNALDLTWHFSQESGIGSRVGFTELRRTAWTFKMVANLGRFGPFDNIFLEVFDIPFDFKQTKLRFLPFPWSFPGRDPFRGGQAVDVSAAFGAPPGTALVEPCFDFTGNPQPNAQANPDFSNAPETGACPTPGRKVSRFTEGLYDPRDPADVNQVGGRIGAFGPWGLNFTLNYMYRRSIVDIAGTSSIRQPGALFRDQNGAAFLQLAPHVSTDEATGQTRQFVGFARVPIEYYHPYVHVFGVSLDYYDGWLTEGAWTGEMAWTTNNPIASRDLVADPNAVRRTDMVVGAISVDRPTWIVPLNKSRVFNVQGQLNFSWQPFHEDIRVDENGEVIAGFVGTPQSASIPGQFRDESSFDRLKGLEILTAVIVNTTYWGGTLIPVVGWVSDWTTAPTMEGIFILQYLPTPYVLLEPQARIFWTNGNTVDDRYSIGRMTRRSEVILKATYQF